MSHFLVNLLKDNFHYTEDGLLAITSFFFNMSGNEVQEKFKNECMILIFLHGNILDIYQHKVVD